MAITKLVITGNTTAVGISSTPIEVSLAHTAKSTSVVPDDNITETNVQSALEQLDDIKVNVTDGNLSNPTITGTADVYQLDVESTANFSDITTFNQINATGLCAFDTDNATAPVTITSGVSLASSATLAVSNNDEFIITSRGYGAQGKFLFKTEELSSLSFNRAEIDVNGDVSFYESTGTTKNLYWDASESNLGLGTTTPGNTLTVGDVENSTVDQDATVGIKCDANDKGIMLQQNVGTDQWAIGVDDNGNLNFYENDIADPVVTFNDFNRSVGIGTQSASELLEVVGADPILVIRDTETNSAAVNSTLRFAETDGVTLGEYWDIGYKNSNFSIDFGVSDLLNIKPTGEVGIGTNSPSELLEVSSATGSTSIDPTIVRISTTTSAGEWDNNSLWGALQFYSADASDGGAKTHAQMGVNTAFSTGGVSDLTFSLAEASSGTLTERMRIDALGNVGIGRTDPSYKLDVGRPDEGIIARFATNNGTTGQRITLETTATGVKAKSSFGTGIAGSFEIEAAGGNSYIALNPNSSEAMRVKPNGVVCINTTDTYGQFTVGTDVAESAADTVFYGLNKFDDSSAIALSTGHIPYMGVIHSNSYYDNSSNLVKPITDQSSGEIYINNTTQAGDTSTFIFGGTSPNSTTFHEIMRMSINGIEIGIPTDNGFRSPLTVFGNDTESLQVGNVGSPNNLYMGWETNPFDTSYNQATITADGIGSDLVFYTTDSYGNTREAMRIDEIGHVAIGGSDTGSGAVDAAADAELLVKSRIKIAPSNADPTPKLELTNNNKDYKLIAEDSTSTIEGLACRVDSQYAFKVDNNGRVNFAQGIRFDGQNSTDNAHLLNDYEEGTWTPTLYGSTSIGTFTSSSASGTFTRIGNIVSVRCKIENVNVVGHNFSGNLYMGGLPFTALDTDIGIVSVCTLFSFDRNTISLNGVTRGAYTRIELRKGHGNLIPLTDLVSNNNGDLSFSLVYRVS
jgi:hypothetical protein